MPQIVLMLALFGFMDYLIVLKWLTDFTENSAAAPSIITMTIDMAMTYGEPSVAGWDPLIAPQATQTKVMQMCILITGACVPLMLCVKPIYEICFASHGHGKHVETEEEFVGGDYATGDNYQRASDFEQPDKILTVQDDAFNVRENLIPSLGLEPPRDHDPIEIFIHQMIETIEFVLGAVSNTASYLRLWALSLAHSQLAKVFYDQLLIAPMQSGSVPMMFFNFFGFIMATFGVLMIMDVLECALHTLRLHWVEYMSKFYKGAGYPFKPTKMKQSI